MIQWKTTWWSDSTMPMSSMAAWQVMVGEDLELAAGEAGESRRWSRP